MFSPDDKEDGRKPPLQQQLRFLGTNISHRSICFITKHMHLLHCRSNYHCVGNNIALHMEYHFTTLNTLHHFLEFPCSSLFVLLSIVHTPSINK